MADTINVQKSDLINQLFFLNEIKQDLWVFHPNNPEQINVVQEYEAIVEEMKSIEEKIESLEN
jgi:hypothetical protein